MVEQIVFSKTGVSSADKALDERGCLVSAHAAIAVARFVFGLELLCLLFLTTRQFRFLLPLLVGSIFLPLYVDPQGLVQQVTGENTAAIGLDKGTQGAAH